MWKCGNVECRVNGSYFYTLHSTLYIFFTCVIKDGGDQRIPEVVAVRQFGAVCQADAARFKSCGEEIHTQDRGEKSRDEFDLSGGVCQTGAAERSQGSQSQSCLFPRLSSRRLLQGLSHLDSTSGNTPAPPGNIRQHKAVLPEC